MIMKSNTKKKEALIVTNLAGFLTFLWNDIRILQAMGYAISVAMNSIMPDGSEAVEVEQLDHMGIKHYQINFDTKSPIAKNNIIAYLQLRKILKNNYDVIHCHTPISGIITRIAANKYRHTGTKVLYTTHGFTFTDRSTKRAWIIYHTVESFMSRFCDAIITINHEDYSNAKTMHCKNVFIIPSVGLDINRFENVKVDRDEYRRGFGVNSEDIMILSVGELSTRKNQQIIIKAIGLLPDKERYVFVICGRAVVNSNIDKQLIQLAKDLGVRLFLAGHRLDIPQINACADIAAIPSLREGFGMAGVEALISGVPVIGADVQGIREYVIPGQTGYLCDPCDAEQFSLAIKKLSALSADQKEKMKAACKEKAREYDVNNSKREMKKIYQSMLGEY